MANATRDRGFEYFGVADHSISAQYAGGLSLDEIAEQHREADRLNKRFGKSFRILKGIEADIQALHFLVIEWNGTMRKIAMQRPGAY